MIKCSKAKYLTLKNLTNMSKNRKKVKLKTLYEFLKALRCPKKPLSYVQKIDREIIEIFFIYKPFNITLIIIDD